MPSAEESKPIVYPSAERNFGKIVRAAASFLEGSASAIGVAMLLFFSALAPLWGPAALAVTAVVAVVTGVGFAIKSIRDSNKESAKEHELVNEINTRISNEKKITEYPNKIKSLLLQTEFKIGTAKKTLERTQPIALEKTPIRPAFNELKSLIDTLKQIVPKPKQANVIPEILPRKKSTFETAAYKFLNRLRAFGEGLAVGSGVTWGIFYALPILFGVTLGVTAFTGLLFVPGALVGLAYVGIKYGINRKEEDVRSSLEERLKDLKENGIGDTKDLQALEQLLTRAEAYAKEAEEYMRQVNQYIEKSQQQSSQEISKSKPAMAEQKTEEQTEEQQTAARPSQHH